MKNAAKGFFFFFFPLPFFPTTTYRGQKVLSWRQQLLGYEWQVSREKCLGKGTSQVKKKKKVVRGKPMQALLLSMAGELSRKVYLS